MFALRAAARYGVPGMSCPVQYGWGRDALMRNAVKERQELRDLRLKAEPPRPAPAPLPRAAE